MGASQEVLTLSLDMRATLLGMGATEKQAAKAAGEVIKLTVQLRELGTKGGEAAEQLKSKLADANNSLTGYAENWIKARDAINKYTAEEKKAAEAIKASASAAREFEQIRVSSLIGNARSSVAQAGARFDSTDAAVKAQIAEREAERRAFERMAGRGLRSDMVESSVAERGAGAVQGIIAKNAALEQQERIYERIAFQMAKGGLAADGKESAVQERGAGAVQSIIAKNTALAEQERLHERIAFQQARGGLARGLHQDQWQGQEGGGLNLIRQKNAETTAYNTTVEQAVSADTKWNTKQAQLQISFAQLTKEVQQHKNKIQELVSAEVQDVNAIEMESRALGKKQIALEKTERALAGSNAALRNTRLMTQSASYAIQDFVQGLSVGSFSMAVRGAANNVETLAATMTLGSSAAVAMAASLVPTLILVGVAIYDITSSAKHSKDEFEKAADAAKKYNDALTGIRDANQEIMKSDQARQEVAAKGRYEEAREIARKEVAETQKDIPFFKAQVRALEKAETEGKGTEFERNIQRMLLERAKEKIRAFEVAKEHLRDVDAAEVERQGRSSIGAIIGGKHREKLIDLAGKAQARGAGKDVVRGIVRDAIIDEQRVTPEQADAAADRFMRESNVNAAEGKFAAVEKRMKAGVDAAQKNVEAVKAGNKGAWAEDQAKDALANARWPMMLFEAFRQSPPGLLLEMRDILTAIRDGVHGDGAIPQNNVARNNANVWNPMQWLPGVK